MVKRLWYEKGKLLRLNINKKRWDRQTDRQCRGLSNYFRWEIKYIIEADGSLSEEKIYIFITELSINLAYTLHIVSPFISQANSETGNYCILHFYKKSDVIFISFLLPTFSNRFTVSPFLFSSLSLSFH